MTQQEFEIRTGLTITAEKYQTIDALYMSTTIDKDAFCSAYTEGMENNPIVENLKFRADRYSASFDTHVDNDKKLAFHLLDIAQGLDPVTKEELESIAWTLIPRKAFTEYKLDKGYALTDSDIVYIKQNLK